MIDVFVCTMDENTDIRNAMFELCWERWQREDFCKIHLITPSLIECKSEEFQRQRRIYAEAHADSSVYVVADDDCLMPPGPKVADMGKLMDNSLYKDFVIVSMWPQNANIMPWTPEGYTPLMDGRVWEHVSVGNIRFCRKGLLEHWPPATQRGYDNTQCLQIRAEGKKVGLARNIPMIHLGEGYYSK